MKISPRHLVWVNLALLALVAYWGASTVSTGIAARLTPPVEVPLRAAPPPITKESHRPPSYYAAIHTRDIFNSTKPQVEVATPTPGPTQLNLKLWGVAVHRDGSSYCIIEDLATRKQELYRPNDVVGGSAVVKEISWDKVILDRNGREEILELVRMAGSTGPAPGKPGAVNVAAAPLPPAGIANPAAPGAPGAPGTTPAENPHIQQLAENQYVIDRSEVDSALDNMNQLFTQVRAVPHFEGGKSTGFRLFAIRQNSIFDQIGLRNGDIIQSINGTELTDPSAALGMVQQLRNQRDLTVNVMRNKEVKTLSYQFR